MTIEENKALIERFPFLLPHNRWTDKVPENKLREMTDMRSCDFVLIVGTKRLIKRKQLEKYLENTTYI